ncbi:MAG: dihydropteroate synthase [Chitinophagales bacterium]|nr:dihydropteroate synthase [Chitinophagales bacterium]
MTLNCRGTLVDLSKPKVMGILNLTPDSFFDGGKYTGIDDALRQTEKMLREGADFIDVGGMSSRPGASIIDESEELKRVLLVLEAVIKQFPEVMLSIDTLRAKVARACVGAGAIMVNDISAGRFDNAMLATVAALKVPFVAMHMQGMPADMQQQPQYTNVLNEVMGFFAERVRACRAAGITDVILDPGFGFGKTIEHNYTLLRNLALFKELNCPLLVGLSRKSMICRVLNVPPAEGLNGTTALNTIALLNGANIIRVHDVKEAKEVVKLLETFSAGIQLGNIH